jgi:hypothetical protein
MTLSILQVAACIFFTGLVVFAYFLGIEKGESRARQRAEKLHDRMMRANRQRTWNDQSNI